MSGHGKIENGAGNGDDHDASGSDFSMIEAPSPEGKGSDRIEIDTMTDGMSDIHVSENTAARRKDEYDIDFE